MDTHLLNSLITLLLIACMVGIAMQWIRQPYTIALVLVGLGIALTKLAPSITLSHDVTFMLILPPLLFQGALHMDLERLKNNFKIIGILAVFGVVFSTFFIGFFISKLWGIELLYALLFGALITPTDPISVLAILKKVGTPERVRTILEGESLFNDGTGVVVFSVILGMITGGSQFHLGETILKFLTIAGGGLLIGIVLGYLVYRILKNIDDHLLEVTLTVVLAFGAPLLAEAFHFSGIIAVVAAGLIMGNYGRIYSMSPKTRETMETFWEVIDFIINSLLFLVIGIELQEISKGDFLRFFPAILWGIIAVLLSRIIVYFVVWGLNQGSRNKIPQSWGHILYWGGLKGSIPIALVVGLPLDFAHRDLFLTAAFSIVLFSLIVQGLTMKPLIKYLGLSEHG